MTKIDFKKKYKHWYYPSKKIPEIIDLPAMNYLMIDGQGYPGNNAHWTAAIETLYAVAFGLKFMFKKQAPPSNYFDYVVPPLEGLWWLPDGNPDFYMERLDDWRWTAMIMQPDFFTQDIVATKVEELKVKKGFPALDKIRLEKLNEGKVAQIMHIGPYSEEGPTIQKLHHFVKEQGLTLRDKHHEIYLSDPRRTAPEKMKTVLRHPVMTA